jgi:hypothetical protein
VTRQRDSVERWCVLQQKNAASGRFWRRWQTVL